MVSVAEATERKNTQALSSRDVESCEEKDKEAIILVR